MAPITHGISPQLDHQLRPTTLRKGVKRMNTIQKGEVLFVRTLISPHRLVATSILVEDRSRDVIMLNLYNFVQEEEDPRKIFPPNTYLAILEPYFRFALDDPSKGAPNIRCDNPQAVVIFDNEGEWRDMQEKCASGENLNPPAPIEVDPILAEEYRQQGNQYFGKREWKKAVKSYSKGLLYHPSSAILLSNRALSYLKLGAWNLALEDANAALLYEPESIKAAYRRCLSLLYLQRPEEALTDANKLHGDIMTKGDSVKEVLTLISDLEIAIREKSGDYDLPRISVEMKTWPFNDPHRHMDFTHPSISRRHVSGKGRAMFAMENLSPSSLIMVSRAFALVEVPFEELRMNISGDSKKIKDGSQALLVPQVIHKLLIDPTCGSDLYSLTAGQQYPDEITNPTRVDVLRINSILSNNQFSGQSDRVACVLKSPTHRVDVSREGNSNRSGLWINPSFFNHSCAPNCHYRIFGDMMFIFTNRAIQRDQELTVGYLDPRLPYSERTEKLSNFGDGFECLCERCGYSRNHSSVALLQEEIIHAYRTAAENCATMPMNVAAESALSSSRRFTLLQKFKKLPLVAQGELIWLLELEGICQFTSGNQSKAIELCQQQIEIELFLFGKTGDSLDLLKAKLRLFSFVTSPPPLAPLATAATHHCPLSSLANEILQEMYSLFCCSGDGILSTADFFLLCKRYVLNPKYHPHISEWLRERGRGDRTTKMGNQQNTPTTPSTTSGCCYPGDEMGSGSNKQQEQKTKKGKKK